MFLSLIKFFHGFLRIQLSGYSPERFLNLCSNHNILIWDLTNHGDGYEFNISIHGFRQLKPLLKKTKTRLKIVKKTGLPFFLYRYRKRKIFFVGIPVCFMLLMYLTTFIWLIDINGNSLITDNTILTYLEEQGASFGTKKKVIDCEQLEESLRTEYPDIIWASVRLKGSKMTIDLQENLIIGETDTSKQTAKPEGAYDIVAEKDAIISSIVTRRGTPNVKAKSAVKAGDILVSSRLDIYNDSNEITSHVYVTADADILGQTVYTYQDAFPLQYTKKVKNGTQNSIYSLDIFSYQISLPSAYKKKEPFISYTESRQLAIAKDYYVPVILEKTTYYACDYQKVSLSRDDAKAKAQENISLFLKKLQEKGIQITDKNVMIDFKDSKCCINARITVIEKIGRYRPAEIQNISTDERQNENESD